MLCRLASLRIHFHFDSFIFTLFLTVFLIRQLASAMISIFYVFSCVSYILFSELILFGTTGFLIVVPTDMLHDFSVSCQHLEHLEFDDFNLKKVSVKMTSLIVLTYRSQSCKRDHYCTTVGSKLCLPRGSLLWFRFVAPKFYFLLNCRNFHVGLKWLLCI